MSVTISVAMCTYNGAAYLEQQLASIAEQRRQCDELIICDDQSTDGTAEIVERWRATVPFPVHLHVNPERLGSTPNFEQAIRRCSGDLIALADQDDVWLDHKLAEAEQAFLANPDLGCWFTDGLIVDDQLRPLGGTLWERYAFDRHKKRKLDRSDAMALLLRVRFVTGATMAFRGRLRPLLLPLPLGFRSMIHDGWIAAMASAVSTVDHSPKPSILYRQHAGQQMGARKKLNFLQSLAERTTKRSGEIAEDVAIACAVNERLQSFGRGNFSQEVQCLVHERMTLLNVRAKLPHKRLRRLKPVISEYASGRYSRHATGITSALKDLLL
jgi:glycosyltransferase involved in cell wall biosynthesis